MTARLAELLRAIAPYMTGARIESIDPAEGADAVVTVVVDKGVPNPIGASFRVGPPEDPNAAFGATTLDADAALEAALGEAILWITAKGQAIALPPASRVNELASAVVDSLIADEIFVVRADKSGVDVHADRDAAPATIHTIAYLLVELGVLKVRT